MGKLIGQAGEAAKVKVRQARKAAVDGIKYIPSEDEQKRAEKHVSYVLHKLCMCHSVFGFLCCNTARQVWCCQVLNMQQRFVTPVHTCIEDQLLLRLTALTMSEQLACSFCIRPARWEMTSKLMKLCLGDAAKCYGSNCRCKT